MLSLDSQEQVRRSRRTEAGANSGVGSGQILGWGLLRLLSKHQSEKTGRPDGSVGGYRVVVTLLWGWHGFPSQVRAAGALLTILQRGQYTRLTQAVLEAAQGHDATLHM
eukprot:5771242-Pyramimonas_sp.AAC.2